MLYQTLTAFLAILIFAVCLYWFGFSEPEIDSIETYSGLYRTDGHRHFSSLDPCGIDEVWTLSGDFRRILIEEEAIDLGFLEPMYVDLKGILSDVGQYGHMGGFDRELEVVEVVRIGPPRDEDACTSEETDRDA